MGASNIMYIEDVKPQKMKNILKISKQKFSEHKKMSFLWYCSLARNGEPSDFLIVKS